MSLNLIKLCVGCDSIGDLSRWMSVRGKANVSQGLGRRHAHVTRMTPKRADELLEGGSLYWVIAGQLAARQRLLAIEPFVDDEGIGRCKLWMDCQVVKVLPRPFRAFQGWRYLSEADAPADLARAGEGLAQMPDRMRAELGALGLI
jgi:hypothetical protein